MTIIGPPVISEGIGRTKTSSARFAGDMSGSIMSVQQGVGRKFDNAHITLEVCVDVFNMLQEFLGGVKCNIAFDAILCLDLDLRAKR